MNTEPTHFCGYCHPPQGFATHEALVEHHRREHPQEPWDGLPQTADDLPGGRTE